MCPKNGEKFVNLLYLHFCWDTLYVVLFVSWSVAVWLLASGYRPAYCEKSDMQKLKILPPGDVDFRASALLKFQIEAFLGNISARPTRLLDSFSVYVNN